MRKISRIRVNEIAFHILDPRSPTKLVLSQATVSTASRQRLAEYICKHITNSLSDEAAKAAKFLQSDSNDSIAQIANNLFADSTNLLNSSQQIAQRLYEIIKNDTRISSGVLAVCLFEDLENNRQQYLAILKLDPASAFRSEIIKDENDKTIVDFETIPDALPTANERLQKCAFIRQTSLEYSYDLMVLDRQTRGGETVSKFFAQKFLNIEFAFDSQTRTKELYKGLIQAQNILRPQLNKQEKANLSQATNYVMRTESVDIDNFVKTLAIPEGAKDVLEKTVMKFVPDRKFKTDPEVGRKMTRKKKFIGEQGVRLEINANDFEHVVEKIEPVGGSQPYTRVVLKIRNFEER